MTSNYKLYNSIILNLGTTIYVFNNRARFISVTVLLKNGRSRQITSRTW